MAFRDRIEVVIDFVTTGAQTSLQKLRTDVAAADTATGKAKAGFTAMGGAISQYGAQAALAAGAALVAFGAKSVQAFTDSALAAGKFADATGLTTEEASRLIEVAGDLGVSAEAVQSSIQRINNAAAKGDLAKFGIDMGLAEDGSYDANQTFLNTIEAIGGIASAAEREAAARKLMGRSWAELAELATMSAEDLAAALGEVSDEKLFDESEVRQAREYRAAMDALKDAVEDVTLAAGKGLTPVITDLAEGVSSLTDALGGSGGGGAIGSVLDFINPVDNVAESIKDLTDGTVSFGDYIRSVGSVLPGFGEILDRTTDKNEELGGVTDFVAEKLAEQQRETELLADGTDDLGGEMQTARSDADQYAAAMEGLNQRLVDAKTAIDDLVGKELSKIDAFREAEDSTRSYTESVEDYVTAALDAETSEDDKAEAMRNAADAAIDAARDMAVFETGAYDTEAGVRAQITALGDMAAALGPNDPLRAELLTHIGLLEGILTDIETDVKFNPDEASITDIETRRALMGREVVVPVRFVGTGSIDNDLYDSGQRAGGSGFSGSSVMPANSLWQQAVNWWAGRQNAGGSGGSSQPVKATQRAKFDAEFKLARAKYERGTYTIPEYLAELRRLQRVYDWPKHSDPGMAIWREIERAETDRREAMKPGRGPGGPDRPVREPGGPDGPSVTGRSGRMGSGTTGGTGGSGGVTLVINAPNAVVVDRKAVQEVFDRYAPNIQRALTKYRNGAG